MSHVRRDRLKVEFKDRGILFVTLKEFGEVIMGEEAFVTNYLGEEKTKVDMALRLKNHRHIQIGFKWNDETKSYEFVGDSFGVWNELKDIQKEYLKRCYIRAFRLKGYTIKEQGNQLVGVRV